MGIKKIHRGISLEGDIRSNAKNEFEKDFFKLMNNSVFGKTMDIRNHVDVRLVNDRKKALKLVAKPDFKHFTIFDENFIAVHMKRTKLVLISQSIVE